MRIMGDLTNNNNSVFNNSDIGMQELWNIIYFQFQ